MALKRDQKVSISVDKEEGGGHVSYMGECVCVCALMLVVVGRGGGRRRRRRGEERELEGQQLGTVEHTEAECPQPVNKKVGGKVKLIWPLSSTDMVYQNVSNPILTY